jgi:hypothetical protein
MGVMVLLLVVLVVLCGGFTYYGYRSYGKYGGLVPAMLVILLIYFLVGTTRFH